MSERRQLLAVTLAALAIWAWIALPVIAGSRTFFLRDVFFVHLPLKAYGAEALHHGRIPAFFDSWALGLPYRGNPQALAFYPGNVFYLILPFWSAFNLHLVLHWLIAFLAMRSLARALGQGAAAQLMAALTYAGGGIVLSALSFYNLLVVLAWWPFVIAGVVRGDRRGLAWAALACGMAMLGGEPVSLVLACGPLLLASVSVHGARRGLGRIAAALGGGALVALPQIVATARILPFTFRMAHGLEGGQAAAYALHPMRIFELWLPLPWGWPARSGAAGWWARRIVPGSPFFFSLHVGIVGIVLAARAARERWGWSAMAVAGVILAWLGGEIGGTLAWASGGLFRYPEKFLVVFALAVPVLAGWGLEATLRSGRVLGWWIGGATSALLALAIGALRWLAPLPAAPYASVLRVQSERWAAYFAVAAVLLALGALCRRASRPAGLVALQLVALVQLWPLLPRIDTAAIRALPPWRQQVPSGAAVHSPAWSIPQWRPLSFGPLTPLEDAACLAPAPGILYGLTYPLAPDFEGLASPLYTFLQRNLAGMNWAERVRWMQVMGVDYAVLLGDVENPALELLSRQDGRGFQARLYRLKEATPAAFWPSAVHTAANPLDALIAVRDLDSVREEAVVSQPVVHDGRGAIELGQQSADHISFATRGGGGVAVIRRGFYPLWRATVDGAPAATQSVDLVLLGVQVPAGEHRVALDVDDYPELAGGIVAFLAVASLLVAGIRRAR